VSSRHADDGALHVVKAVDTVPELPVFREGYAREEVGAEKGALHKLKLEMVQEVTIVFEIPNIKDHLVLAKPSVFWLIFVPNAPGLIDIAQGQENDADKDLRYEQILL